MPSTRRSNRERREESIESVLDAARLLFVSRGYQATSTADIARRAGLTKGALYFYFKDKQALVNELLQRSERTLYRPFFARLEKDSGTADEKIIRLLNWLAKIAAENRDDLLLPLLISLEFQGQENPALERVDELRHFMKRRLVKVIEQGRAEGSMRSDLSAQAFADTIMAFADGLLLQWYRRGSELDGATVARAARGVILEGVRA